MTGEEAQAKVHAFEADNRVVRALCKAMRSYAATCETRGYRLTPKVLKIYADHIEGAICATKEQDSDS